MLNLYLLIAVVAGALASVVVRAARCPLSGIPGPWYSRVTRLVLKYHIIAGREMYYVHALHRRYGPLVRTAPDEAAVADLAALAQIHRVGGAFVKGPFYDGALMPAGTGGGVVRAPEPGIFAMRDPKMHAARRRLLARAFSKTALRANWERVVRQTVEKAVARIKAEAQQKQQQQQKPGSAAAAGGADILKWWMLMATDVIVHLSFGESFDMVGLGKKTAYFHALQNFMMTSGIRYELPWLYAAARRIPFKAVREVLHSNELVFEAAGKAVRILRQHDGEAQNLFSQMLDQSESQGEEEKEKKKGKEEQTHHHPLSDLSIRLEATNLIIAGSDTTAVTLTYLVWAVLKRPQLQRRLEAEVAGLSPDFGEEDLEGLPLLNSVINETLRLYGAAPGSLQRVVPEGGATVAGHFLPAGILISTQAYTSHRDASVFERPEIFDETRWMHPQSPTQKLAFSPFSTGSRGCVGIHLARMELRLATALFFRECRGARLSPDTTDAVMEMEHHFLVAPKGHFCNIVLPPP